MFFRGMSGGAIGFFSDFFSLDASINFSSFEENNAYCNYLYIFLKKLFNKPI
jgi:hypothetical protein